MKTNGKYRQIYRKDWEVNPLFKDWLSSVPCDKYKAVCIACKKELLAHRLTLLKHASSAKHLNRLNLNKTKLLESQEIEGEKIPMETRATNEDLDTLLINLLTP